MNIINVNGMNITIDQEGFLENISEWSPAVAEILAQRQGVILNEAHWEVLRVTRDFYEQYEFSPNQRPFVKYIGLMLGADKGNSRYLMHLFPGSPAKVASMIAGLPKPSHCF